MKQSIKSLILAPAIFALSLMFLPATFAQAGALSSSVGKEQSVTGVDMSLGGSGGRNVLGTHEGRKEVYDGARSASISSFYGASIYYWVDWPYLYTNRAVSRKGRSYGGTFRVYDFRTSTHLNSAGIGTGTGSGMVGGYNDILDFSYGGFSVTPDGLKTMGGSNFRGTSPAGAYRIDNKECASSFAGNCIQTNIRYTIYWIK